MHEYNYYGRSYENSDNFLIYERNDDEIYVRQSLKNERILMTKRSEPVLYDGLTAIDLLNIIDMAEKNVAIRDLLDELKTVYYLTKGA